MNLLSKGTPVKYSEEGLKWRPKKPDVRGVVVGHSRDGEVLRVQWDDRSAPMYVLPGHVETVQ